MKESTTTTVAEHESANQNNIEKKQPGSQSIIFRLLPYALLILAILLIPRLLFKPSPAGNNYFLTVLIYVGINTILAVGLNLLMGYAGQVSLGHAAFYGIGAYASAVLTANGWSPWLAMGTGVIVTCIVAFLLGVQALRLYGYYLAMATLGFGFIVSIVFLEWTPLGGTSGIYGIPNLQMFGHTIGSDISMYYLVWGLVTIVIALSANIINSRVGRAFRAVHGSEVAASTLGVNVNRYKLQVFVLSAALASIAGSLYAHYVTFISPEPFGFKFSVELVVMVVVGGMASIWGAIFGAGAVTFLSEFLSGKGQGILIGHAGLSLADFDVVLFGLILMLIMIFLPSGLVRGLVDSVKLAMSLARGKRGQS